MALARLGARGGRVSSRENPQFSRAKRTIETCIRACSRTRAHADHFQNGDSTNNYTWCNSTGAVRETPFVTDAELRDVARLATQTRDIAYLGSRRSVRGDDYGERRRSGVLLPGASAGIHDGRYRRRRLRAALDLRIWRRTILCTDGGTEVAAQYEADAKAFKPNERRQVAHILSQVNDSRTEDAAKAELNAIKDRVGARREIRGNRAQGLPRTRASATSGGDLGVISKGAMVPEFEAPRGLYSRIRCRILFARNSACT